MKTNEKRKKKGMIKLFSDKWEIENDVPYKSKSRKGRKKKRKKERKKERKKNDLEWRIKNRMWKCICKIREKLLDEIQNTLGERERNRESERERERREGERERERLGGIKESIWANVKHLHEAKKNPKNK